MASRELTRTWTPPWPVNIPATVGLHRRGSADPTFRIDSDGTIWRASFTPDGPGTLAISALRSIAQGGNGIHVRAWGAGAEWLLETMPSFVGADDDPSMLVPRDDKVAALVRRSRGLRIGRTDRVWEALAPAIFEQKITGRQAWRSWRHLVGRYGEPAPGPGGLVTPPPPQVWRDIPSWEWHQAGLEAVRMRTIRAATRVDVERNVARLNVIAGIGQWTMAEVAARALGNPDAVSVGDYHLANHIGVFFTGRRVDDAEMLTLLEPYAGQRFRVIRMIELFGGRPQRFGPRMSIPDYRNL